MKKKAPTKSKSKTTKKSPLKKFVSSLGNSRKIAPAVFIVLFASVGVYALLRSQAETSSPPPPAGGYFSTSAPGSALPSEADCVGKITRSAWEPRPENKTANHTVPASVSLPGFTPYYGYDSRVRAYADRVTGNFTGTTDEIIQWASCKWGLSDDITRAVAVTETTWYQGLVDAAGQPINGRGYGDYTTDQAYCQEGYTAPCPESFGLTQIKERFHEGTFPSSRDSTAFNIDYALMLRRICYEGWVNWINHGQPPVPYGPGDEWGCVGLHFSGSWYNEGAQNYTAVVKDHFDKKPWLDWFDSSLIGTPGNLAAGKGVTTSAPWVDNLARVTDGLLASNQYANMASGPQWVTVDLGQSYDLERLRFWHYYTDKRTYRDVIVQLSNTADFSSGVTTVFNNDSDNTAGQGVGSQTEYAESSAGKELLISPGVNARYVRLWSNGSSVNYSNHYVEVEAYGAAAPTTPPPPPAPAGDTTAPAVSITSPTDGARIKRGVRILGKATDDSSVTKMEVYVDNQLMNSSATGSIRYNWDARKTSAGSHTIAIKAYDNAGNAGQATVTLYK